MGRWRRLLAAVVVMQVVGAVGCFSYSPSTWGDVSDPTPQRAEAPPSARRLPDITITARRHPDQAFDVPYSSQTIRGTDIRNRRLSRSLPEALKETVGISVQKTGHGQGAPKIRGLTGFHTLLLIDGIRLNNSVFRSGNNQYWNSLDPLIVERLEVVKGPGSVLYGSDAVGGTVNAVTREASLSHKGVHGSGRAYYRYATAEDSHTGRLEVSGSIDQTVGILAGSSLRDFGDLRGGRHVGRMDNTGYNEQDGDIKLSWLVSDYATITFAHQRVDQNSAPRTHSTLFSEPWRNLAIGSDSQRDLDQRRDLTYLQLDMDEPTSWISDLKISLSHHRQEEEERRIRSNGRRRRQGFTVTTLGLFAVAQSPTEAGDLTYGFEYYTDQVSSFFKEWNADGSLRKKRPRGPVADDAQYDLLGLFVQDEFALCENLELTVGTRFNYTRVDADKVDPDPTDATLFAPIHDSWRSVVGSSRLVYHAGENVNLFAGLSQGFRSPNLSDLTRFDASRSGEFETPAPDLDPEKFLAYETGVKYLDDTVRGQIAFFYTQIHDMIIRHPTGATVDGSPEVTKSNVGEGFLRGVEIDGAFQLPLGFSSFGNFAWTEGEVDTFTSLTRKERKPFNSVPPMQALLGLRWDSVQNSCWVEALVRIVDNQDRLSPRDAANTTRIPPGGTPGYSIYTVRGGTRLADRVQLTVSIENLTNKDYRVIDSGLNEPGLNMIVALDVDL